MQNPFIYFKQTKELNINLICNRYTRKKEIVLPILIEIHTQILTARGSSLVEYLSGISYCSDSISTLVQVYSIAFFKANLIHLDKFLSSKYPSTDWHIRKYKISIIFLKRVNISLNAKQKMKLETDLIASIGSDPQTKKKTANPFVV